MTHPFIPYAKHSIQLQDSEAVSHALKEDRITRGPLVEQFEKSIAEYCNAPFAVVFNSGTAALFAAYFAANLSAGDRVITSPNSFIATIGAPLQKRNTLNFIDIHRSHGGLDSHRLKDNMGSPKSRGKPIVVPVHFSGIAADMQRIEQQISDPSTIIIEDAAHALGSLYPTGEKVGSCAYSHMTIFSFHPSKIITCGEGGAVTTHSEEMARRLKLFRDNGINRSPKISNLPYKGFYDVETISGNFNFTSFQAALGMSQLQQIDTFISKRRSLVQHYRQRLAGLTSLKLFSDRSDAITAFHLFVVQIDFSSRKTTRSTVMQKLYEKGIGTEVHYIPLYQHTCVKKLCHATEEMHEMEHYFKETLTLPLYVDLTHNEVDFICDELLKALNISIG